jgi:N6-L-threonylcarbamoyladenine synthase
MRSGSGLILGIESSCDETAAAVVRAGGEVLANVVASQIALHAKYGGVVPELASREHLRNIVPVVRAAMAEAGVEFAELDAIAVTEGPGLAGALLVGITYAKALALGVGKPLIAVNHLEGHIHAVVMEQGTENREQGTGSRVGPMLALVVSGGHTHLYLAEFDEEERRTTEILTRSNAQGQNDERKMGAPASRPSGAWTGHPNLWRYRNVGRTVDDAAGEAFDKVAKLLGLGYPGGPWMDALARSGNPRAVEFRFQQIKARRGQRTENPTHDDKTVVNGAPNVTFDFSFSGIKTAVLRYIQGHGMGAVVEARRAALADALKANPAMRPVDALREMPEVFDRQTLDLIASFQYAVVGNLMRQTFAAAEALGARGIVVSGGVSANSELRRRFAEEAARRGLRVEFPSLTMSTDNAAMIAAAAWGKFCAGEFAKEGLVATPGLKLG